MEYWKERDRRRKSQMQKQRMRERQYRDWGGKRERQYRDWGGKGQGSERCVEVYIRIRRKRVKMRKKEGKEWKAVRVEWGRSNRVVRGRVMRFSKGSEREEWRMSWRGGGEVRKMRQDRGKSKKGVERKWWRIEYDKGKCTEGRVRKEGWAVLGRVKKEWKGSGERSDEEETGQWGKSEGFEWKGREEKGQWGRTEEEGKR